ncbi:hypothetical protein GL263_26130, partial [Streptomyces durbertensis]
AGPRPAVTELRISAFRGVRGLRLPLGPLTLLSGPSGSGKSTVIEAYEVLARLASGERLREVFGTAPGGPRAFVPQQALPDALGRRGFRLGCTVTGPAGEVRLDLAVQAEPSLRVVGERLADQRRVLLATALRDPGRPVVQAEWHTAGVNAVTRAPLPDDQLCTSLLPLRVAGTTQGQRQVLAAAEQVVLALRSAFLCDPRPETMRETVAAGDETLRGSCDNLAAVLRRLRAESPELHAELVEAVSAGCAAGPLRDLRAEGCPGPEGGMIRAVAERADGRRVPVEWFADGELRHAALALVLLFGTHACHARAPREVPPGQQTLMVLADGLDRALDDRQNDALLALAARRCGQGRVRLLGTVTDAERAAGVPGVDLVRLGGERRTRTSAPAADPGRPTDGAAPAVPHSREGGGRTEAEAERVVAQPDRRATAPLLDSEQPGPLGPHASDSGRPGA